MSVRLRRPRRLGIRSRIGGMVSTEERQQATVTILFIGTIVAVALIFVGAISVGWYNDNLRPVGKVGSVEIPPQMLRDKTSLENWRIARDESRITEAQIAGQIDDSTAAAKKQALTTRSSSLSTGALGILVDSIYESQLAPDNGVNVTQDQIDARYEQEISDPEQRHVYVIAIAPTVADTTNGPTTAERLAALDQANKALADLQAGKDFSETAKTYGTDNTSKTGGDLGTVTQISISDDEFGNELFKLPANGTTGIVLGADSIYRIGRVTDITPGAESPSLKSGLTKLMSEDEAKKLIGYDVAAQALSDKIVGDALAQTPEQVKLAVIYIAGLASGDTNTTDGEIDYYQIVYAPNDDQTNATSLASNDPAWATAKTQADAEVASLNAITDVDARIKQFQTDATANSDDATSTDGGHVTYTTRDVPPQQISDALWTGTHNKGDILGPVQGDDGWYVLLYNDKRPSSDERMKEVQDALAQPNADFNALAKQYSDGPEKDQGGEIGWFTKDGLSSDVADKVFALDVGGVTDPLELGEGHYFLKVEDKQVRPLDADQQATARASAFDTWYQPQKTAAISDGTITTVVPLGSSDTSTTDLTGGDQPSP
jgi:parvulin-like peptidyl-prolyl isomerase